MSELQSSIPETSGQQAATTPGKEAVPTQPVQASKAHEPKPLVYILLLALAVGVGGSWWHFNGEMKSLRSEVAKRLQAADTGNAEMKGVVNLVQDGTKELQSQVSVLESKQAEAQGQQVALEQLYQDLSKNTDERTLSQIEDLLSTASRQLELAGNVKGALLALQNADKSLAKSDKQQFTSIRRALANDITRLQAVPEVDVTGMALRLDSVIAQVDKLPLIIDEHQPEEMVAAKTMAAHAKARPVDVPDNAGTVEADGMTLDWWTSARLKWQSLSAELWTQVRQMVNIRRVDRPDALLMSPSQAYFVKENLKLRVLNARFALLSRNDVAFRDDLNTAQTMLGQYFDTRANQVQAVQSLLKQVQATDVSIEMPTLSESINAVHNFQARR